MPICLVDERQQPVVRSSTDVCIAQALAVVQQCTPLGPVCVDEEGNYDSSTDDCMLPTKLWFDAFDEAACDAASQAFDTCKAGSDFATNKRGEQKGARKLSDMTAAQVVQRIAYDSEDQYQSNTGHFWCDPRKAELHKDMDISLKHGKHKDGYVCSPNMWTALEDIDRGCGGGTAAGHLYLQRPDGASLLDTVVGVTAEDEARATILMMVHGYEQPVATPGKQCEVGYFYCAERHSCMKSGWTACEKVSSGNTKSFARRNADGTCPQHYTPSPNDVSTIHASCIEQLRPWADYPFAHQDNCAIKIAAIHPPAGFNPQQPSYLAENNCPLEVIDAFCAGEPSVWHKVTGNCPAGWPEDDEHCYSDTELVNCGDIEPCSGDGPREHGCWDDDGQCVGCPARCSVEAIVDLGDAAEPPAGRRTSCKDVQWLEGSRFQVCGAPASSCWGDDSGCARERAKGCPETCEIYDKANCQNVPRAEATVLCHSFHPSVSERCERAALTSGGGPCAADYSPCECEGDECPLAGATGEKKDYKLDSGEMEALYVGACVRGQSAGGERCDTPADGQCPVGSRWLGSGCVPFCDAARKLCTREQLPNLRYVSTDDGRLSSGSKTSKAVVNHDDAALCVPHNVDCADVTEIGDDAECPHVSYAGLQLQPNVRNLTFCDGDDDCERIEHVPTCAVVTRLPDICGAALRTTMAACSQTVQGRGFAGIQSTLRQSSPHCDLLDVLSLGVPCAEELLSDYVDDHTGACYDEQRGEQPSIVSASDCRAAGMRWSSDKQCTRQLAMLSDILTEGCWWKPATALSGAQCVHHGPNDHGVCRTIKDERTCNMACSPMLMHLPACRWVSSLDKDNNGWYFDREEWADRDFECRKAEGACNREYLCSGTVCMDDSPDAQHQCAECVTDECRACRQAKYSAACLTLQRCERQSGIERQVYTRPYPRCEGRDENMQGSCLSLDTPLVQSSVNKKLLLPSSCRAPPPCIAEPYQVIAGPQKARISPARSFCATLTKDQCEHHDKCNYECRDSVVDSVDSVVVIPKCGCEEEETACTVSEEVVLVPTQYFGGRPGDEYKLSANSPDIDTGTGGPCSLQFVPTCVKPRCTERCVLPAASCHQSELSTSWIDGSCVVTEGADDPASCTAVQGTWFAAEDCLIDAVTQGLCHDSGGTWHDVQAESVCGALPQPPGTAKYITADDLPWIEEAMHAFDRSTTCDSLENSLTCDQVSNASCSNLGRSECDDAAECSWDPGRIGHLDTPQCRVRCPLGCEVRRLPHRAGDERSGCWWPAVCETEEDIAPAYRDIWNEDPLDALVDLWHKPPNPLTNAAEIYISSTMLARLGIQVGGLGVSAARSLLSRLGVQTSTPHAGRRRRRTPTPEEDAEAQERRAQTTAEAQAEEDVAEHAGDAGLRTANPAAADIESGGYGSRARTGAEADGMEIAGRSAESEAAETFGESVCAFVTFGACSGWMFIAQAALIGYQVYEQYERSHNQPPQPDPADMPLSGDETVAPRFVDDALQGTGYAHRRLDRRGRSSEA